MLVCGSLENNNLQLLRLVIKTYVYLSLFVGVDYLRQRHEYNMMSIQMIVFKK